MIDADRFWELVSRLRGEADEDAFYRLSMALRALPAEDLLGFQDRLAQVLHEMDQRSIARQKWRSSDHPRWLPRIPGISPDGFLYARCAAVVDGPATVAGILADHAKFRRTWDLGAELLLSSAPGAYEAATGSEWDYNRPTAVSYETGQNPNGGW